MRLPQNNDDLNSLFEKLTAGKDQGIKQIEQLKQRMTTRLDKEIAVLYAKKDLIAEMWTQREHLKLEKLSVLRKFLRNSWRANLCYIVSMPFIYMIIMPALIMHAMAEIYHQVCFRLYGIPLVNSKDYFIFDRRLLPYLNWFEKFNCFYCSYFNCLISYIREIAGRTERYWCPIKHSKFIKDPHSQYDLFVDYSDGEELRKRWNKLKRYDSEK